MRKFTIAFSVFLLALFSGMLIFTALTPDFVPPSNIRAQGNLAADNPIWDKTLDDLAEYFVEEGVIENTEYDLLVDGIASDARLYSEIELYWWDLDNLSEDDELFLKYQDGLEERQIEWMANQVLNVEVHGPFAVGYYAYYEGDADKMLEAFRNYCME